MDTRFVGVVSGVSDSVAQVQGVAPDAQRIARDEATRCRIEVPGAVLVQPRFRVEPPSVDRLRESSLNDTPFHNHIHPIDRIDRGPLFSELLNL
jgi:hypothetical protein